MKENRQILKISVVDFHTAWGDKRRNLQKMEEYTEYAAAEGAQMVLFPELALTGYDYAKPKEGGVCMQHEMAEVIPGPATAEMAEYAKKHAMYVIFGMPEQDATGEIYNTAAVISPMGEIGRYRKMHSFGEENIWAKTGKEPFLFETPWGPVGVSICYDTFNYPEIIRYYRARGARLILNCSANSISASHKPLIRKELEGQILQNWVYIASANLVGKDHSEQYFGGSSVAGPSLYRDDVQYYIGNPYYSRKGRIGGMHTGTIDLTIADEGVLPIYKENCYTGAPDFSPEIYAGMYSEL